MPERQSRDDMVAAWKRLKLVSPEVASGLDPFIREFGCDELLFVSFERPPPRVRGFTPYFAVLEQQVTAFPAEARRILAGLEDEAAMDAEARAWWG